jgi:hypothetical protein
MSEEGMARPEKAAWSPGDARCDPFPDRINVGDQFQPRPRV